MKFIREYKSEESGNVGLMFAVSLVAIVGVTGAALDYGNLSKANDRLQSQVDAAVLAAVSVGLREEDGYDGTRSSEERIRKGVALTYLEVNGFDVDANPPTITLTNDNTLYASAGYDYPLAFGGLLGATTSEIAVESESGLGTGGPVQIALVLDNTLSMYADGKMNALKEGARNLTNTIEERGDGSEIALVPFARYVRIPESEFDAQWLDVPEEFDYEITWQQATHSGGECHTEMQTRVRDGQEEEYETTVCTDQTTTYETQSRTIESRFTGCVGTRTEPLSEEDGSYTLERVPGLLDRIHQQYSGTYDSNAYCATAITPLTDDFDSVIAAVNELYATDQTYLPSGLLWGRTVLSPGEPFDNLNENSAQKIMVLMTDGRNSAQIQSADEAEDEYHAPPYIATSELENEYSPDANAATLRMCQNVKDDGITIYTIAFQVDDEETQDLLNVCATDSTMALNAASNDELILRFNHISGSLVGNARLMR